MTKVKIVSDGSAPGTQVYVNGQQVDKIVEIKWHIKDRGLAEVTLKLSDVELDVDGQVALKFEESRAVGVREVITTDHTHRACSCEVPIFISGTCSTCQGLE